MKNRITLALLGLTISSGALAFGEVGRWSSGWGQGVSEYTVVDAKQNQLYIACGDEPARMQLTVNGRQYGYGAAQGFSLVIDGRDMGEPYETESRVGSDIFKATWAALRKGKTLVAKLPNGQKIPLPLTGAAKVLPSSQSKTYPCRTEW